LHTAEAEEGSRSFSGPSEGERRDQIKTVTKCPRREKLGGQGLPSYLGKEGEKNREKGYGAAGKAETRGQVGGAIQHRPKAEGLTEWISGRP